MRRSLGAKLGECSPPVGRRSLGGRLIKPSAVGLSPANISDGELLLVDNDDETERRQRLQHRILDQQEKHLNSPSTPSRKRVIEGNALSGLNNEQIAEHYEECMRMSTENKITKKNAFGLHLIDYFASMILKSKEPSETTNFQLASCTLDASTKIYSCRVDSLHNDALNMTTNIGSAVENNKQRNNNDNAEDDFDPTGEPKKKKRESRKSQTVETNLKNINLNSLELQYEPDMFLQNMTSAWDDSGVSGLLCYNLMPEDDRCELMMSAGHKPPSYTCQRFEQDLPMAPKFFNLKELFGNIVDKFPDSHICPTLKDFEFLNDQNLDFMKNSCNSVPTQSKSNVTLQNQQDYAFDPESCDVPDDNDDNGPFYEDGFENDGQNADDSLDSDETKLRDGLKAGNDRNIVQPRFGTTNELFSILADNEEAQSDFSYFDRNSIMTWGGPNHWRMKNIPKPKTAGGAERNKGKRIRKEHLKIDFAVEFDETIKCSRSSKLLNTTIKAWTTHSITLPQDMHFLSNDFFKALLNPNLILKKTKKVENLLDVDGGDEDGQYNYENSQDVDNYCPNNEDDSDDDIAAGNFNDKTKLGFADETLTQQFPTETVEMANFTGDNLLQQPYKIDKGKIEYEKTAKKIDIKKVKNAMWRILTKTTEDLSNPAPNEMDEKMMFSDLFKCLPKHLSETAARNVSMPIAFVFLLHLVNEKQLTLTGKDDLSDFTIQQ